MVKLAGQSNPKRAKESFFLPDFCHARSVFMVVLTAEILALMLSLTVIYDGFWLQLGRFSLIIQWIALLSTGLLCWLKPFLRAYSDAKAGLLSYLLILVVTSLVTILALITEDYLFAHKMQSVSDYLLSQQLSLNLLIASVFAAVALRFFYLQAQYRRRVMIAAEARLQALQAKIQPHFLFNSMNIIASLIPVDPETAERVVEDLSDLFRVSLSEQAQEIGLDRELELCKRYLSIEQLRIGDRLKLDIDVTMDISRVKLPPLSLQPLVENAIYHGIQPLEEGGTLRLSISQVKDGCLVELTNPVAATGSGKSTGNGLKMAVDNVRERLVMLYDDEAKLITENRGELYYVSMLLPLADDKETRE